MVVGEHQWDAVLIQFSYNSHTTAITNHVPRTKYAAGRKHIFEAFSVPQNWTMLGLLDPNAKPIAFRSCIIQVDKLIHTSGAPLVLVPLCFAGFAA